MYQTLFFSPLMKHAQRVFSKKNNGICTPDFHFFSYGLAQSARNLYLCEMPCSPGESCKDATFFFFYKKKACACELRVNVVDLFLRELYLYSFNK